MIVEVIDKANGSVKSVAINIYSEGGCLIGKFQDLERFILAV